MVSIPAEIPDTTPLPDIVAITVLLLVQVPPEIVSFSVIKEPSQTVFVPVIEAGAGFTETVIEMVQPVGKVYITVSIPEVAP